MEAGLLEVETGTFDGHTDKQIWEYEFDEAGTYKVAFGVIDIDDFIVTSALSVENVEVIPEPLTILGTATAIGCGCGFKRSLKKTNKNKK